MWINIIVFLALSFVYSKNALHMFQQNRYEFYRYTKWLFNRKNVRFNLTALYVLVAIVFLFIADNYYIHSLFLFITLAYAIYMIYQESKRSYIKPLVYTQRVKRAIVIYTILLVLVQSVLNIVIELRIQLTAVLSIYLPYLLIYPMAVIAYPIEERIKKGFENEARDIINSYDDLIKIGITGSFGKTTTKNVVKDIIGEQYYTLITPASYNTPMGITRTIREYLKPIHEVFVCEMGADHVGEISYLMDFVKPKYGIVVSIGPQHLNTFHNIENIIHEKMQEIEMLPVDGVGIVNLDNEYIANYPIKNSCKIVSVGIKNKSADLVAEDISFTRQGSTFTVEINGEKVLFETILLGEHNITNLLCGIALAIELGIPISDIQKNVAAVNQVEHRLEIKKINGFTFIDNAFNSNPVGSRYALDVLEMMSGKRIIVTPGLIDLGKIEDEANFEFGKYMTGKADMAILVGRQSEAILRGLKAGGFNMDNVTTVSSVKEAFALIYASCSAEDTILLENDLPDAFLY